MANRYDTPKMKAGAEAIEKELKNFEQIRSHMDETITRLQEAWNDETHRRYAQRYNRDAKPTMEEVSKTMNQLAALLKECAKRFSDVIDNGNANLAQ